MPIEYRHKIVALMDKIEALPSVSPFDVEEHYDSCGAPRNRD